MLAASGDACVVAGTGTGTGNPAFLTSTASHEFGCARGRALCMALTSRRAWAGTRLAASRCGLHLVHTQHALGRESLSHLPLDLLERLALGLGHACAEEVASAAGEDDEEIVGASGRERA